MKNWLPAALLGVYLLASCKSADSPQAVVTPPVSTSITTTVAATYTFGTTPSWQDEFSYTGLPDSTKWGYDIGGSGWGNNELEYYTKDLKNAHVENGVLSIEALRENVGSRRYSSARMVTKGKAEWLYGRYEIRAKLPEGRGTWPAIWMLASKQTYGTQYWPDNGEIDIMEHVGYDPTVIHGSMHTKTFNFTINTQKTATRRIDTALSDFHVYALEWDPDKIKFIIDEDVYLEVVRESNWNWDRWPFDQKFHLLLNLAVGGDWGGAKGVDDSIFPKKMEVDYVRVYPLVKK